jgi:hypothetical protein
MEVPFSIVAMYTFISMPKAALAAYNQRFCIKYHSEFTGYSAGNDIICCCFHVEAGLLFFILLRTFVFQFNIVVSLPFTFLALGNNGSKSLLKLNSLLSKVAGSLF